MSTMVIATVGVDGGHGCGSSDHRLELLAVQMVWDSGVRWADTSAMDCGCVNRPFVKPSTETLEQWRQRVIDGTEPIYFD